MSAFRYRTALLGVTLWASLARAQSAPAPVNSTPVMHRAVATERGYDANAWWIETNTGIVLIDALLMRSDARMLVAALKTTGKPLAAVFLTHPHVDHFGGLPTIRAAFPGVPVIATRATADGIRPTHDAGMAAGWLAAYGDEYDRNFVLPDRIVASGDTVRYAGIDLIVRDYGPIESSNNSVIYAPALRVLFTGDATVHGASVYVGEGHSKAAITALERMRKDYADGVLAYAGHYGPRPLASTIAENLEQIRAVRGMTFLIASDSSNRTSAGTLTDVAAQRLLRMLATYASTHADYGVGARSIAAMNMNGLIPELSAELATMRVPVPTSATRSGMGALTFLVGQYTNANFAMGMGGLYVDGVVEAQGGYRYQLVFSFDHVQQLYRVASHDNISGLVDVFEGTRDAAGNLVVTNVRAGTHYLDAKGNKVFNRMIFIPLANGSWSWRVESGAGDGQWTQMLEQPMVRVPIR